MNGLLYVLESLKKHRPEIKFIITERVKYETVDRPLKVPRFELGALRVKRLLNNKTLELPQSLKIGQSSIKTRTQKLMKEANNLIESRGKKIEIVSDAEVSCLALSSILSEKNIENLIAIDERTTRILSENPRNLEKIMSRKLHSTAKLRSKDFSSFKNFKFIRSSELVYVAHKLGLLRVKAPKALEAVLYATKFKGSSISWDEIKALRKM